MSTKTKLIIIGAIVGIVIVIIVVIMLFQKNDTTPTETRVQEEETIATEEAAVAETEAVDTVMSQTKTEEMDANVELPDNYNEDQEPIDNAIGQLPIQNNDYFLYSPDGI